MRVDAAERVRDAESQPVHHQRSGVVGFRRREHDCADAQYDVPGIVRGHEDHLHRGTRRCGEQLGLAKDGCMECAGSGADQDDGGGGNESTTGWTAGGTPAIRLARGETTRCAR